MNWATWQPSSVGELIGKSAINAYRNIEVQMKQAKEASGREATMRVALCGPPGTGKTTIANFIGKQWVDHHINLKRWKGRQVSAALASEEVLASQSYSLFGKYRFLIINEADKVQPAAQDIMLDWLEDELPEGYAVFITTNLKAATQEHLDKKAISKASKSDEYLDPKFISRFEDYDIKPPQKEEAAEGLARITDTPLKVALAAANKAAGDLRKGFKEINKYKAQVILV